MSDYLAILALLIFFFALGEFLLAIIFPAGSLKVVRLSLSYGIGVGIFTLFLFYYNLAGFPLSRLFIISVIAFVLVLSVILVIYRKRKVQFSLSHKKIFSPYLLIGAILFVLLVVKSLVIPLHCFDDRAKWAMKAKIIYHEKTVITSEFSDIHRLHIDRNYPLLLPYLEASAFFMMGKSDDRKIKIFFPFFLLMTVILLLSFLRENSFFSHSALFSVYLLALPYVHYSPLAEGGSADTGYADLPLALFYFAGVATLLNFGKTIRGLLLSSLFIAFAMFTKLEGIIMYVAWLCYLLFSIMRGAISAKADKNNSDKYNFLKTLIVLLLPFSLMAPFFIFASTLPQDGIDYAGNFTLERIVANAHRFFVIIVYFVSALFSLRWAFLGLVSAISFAIFFSKVKQFENAVLLWFIIFPLACYSVLLEITPADVYWQLEVAVDRLILHVAPILIYFIGRISVPSSLVNRTDL